MTDASGRIAELALRVLANARWTPPNADELFAHVRALCDEAPPSRDAFERVLEELRTRGTPLVGMEPDGSITLTTAGQARVQSLPRYG